MKKPATRSAKHSENTISNIFLGAITLFACVAIAIRPLVPGMASGADANMFIEAFVFVPVCLWVLRMALHRRLSIVNTGLEIPLAAFLILAFVSVGISSYKLPSLKVALDWTSFFLLFLLVANLCVDNHWRNIFLQVLLASTFVVAVNGFYQYFFAFPDVVLLIAEADPAEIISRLRLPITIEQFPDFKARAMSNEVYSTFIIPNSLAGFLTIMLPVLLGYLIDLFRRKFTALSIMPIAAAGCGLAALLACLYLSNAKGGWAAGACGLMVFGALVCYKMPLKLRRIILVAALIVVIVGGSLLITGTVDTPTTGISDSFEVRAGYWRGTYAAIKDHLWFGVGLDNFGDYYAMYKDVSADETQKAHNNYLQVWLEMGIFGLIAFMAIWIVFVATMLRGFRNAFQKDSVTLGGEQGLYLMGIGAWLFTFWLLVSLAQFIFTGLEPFVAAVFAVFWLAYYVLSIEAGRMERRPFDMQFSMMGIFAGVIVFLIHSIIDFDLYVHGIFQSIIVLLGIALPFRGLQKRQYIVNLELKVRGQIICCCAAVVILVIPMFFVLRSGSAAVHMWSAERAIITASKTKEEIVFLNQSREAIEEFKKALAANPFDDKACMGIARISEQLYLKTGQRTFLSQAMEYNRKAIELRPHSASHHFRLANLYVIGLQHDMSDISSVISEFKAAAENYPARPMYRAYLGMAYARAENTDNARRELLKALELDRNSRVDRLRLEPDLRVKIQGWLEQNPQGQTE